ncbi:MAG: CocE/NonD family hydrolase [Bacteroidota bacterium]
MLSLTTLLLGYSMSSKLKTLKAAWPVLRSAIARGQLFRPQCELVDPDPDLVAHYDVEIPMSEGYSLTANVFHSRSRRSADQSDPVVMCAHPYDNHHIPDLGGTPFGGPPQQYRLLPQSGGTPRFSTLTSWESPDPNFWVPAGYTLVNLNLPGFANSGGPASVMTHHQGMSFREAIAWVGAQDWCDGNVGLCGVSFLCISQYLAAALPDGEDAPEALKCISPWEGVSDLYHDLACRGGVPDVGFLNFWWHTEVKDSMNNSLAEYLETEEAIPLEALRAHPFYDEYWKAKAPPLENIRVPMLVCASFSDHELHTFGSFRAYEKAQSQEKWVYTHRSGKWTEFYKPESLALQKDFMDRFLKNKPNQFDSLPSARIEIRQRRDVVKEVRWTSSWPLKDTTYQPLHLAQDRSLATAPQSDEQEAVYDGSTGKITFDYTFSEDTEVIGYIKLKVWVESRGGAGQPTPPDDMVLCCFIDKLDAEGQTVRFYGSVGQDQDMVTRGYGRAALRELNQQESRPFHPVLAAARNEPLQPGEIVPLELAFCPSSTFFEKGSTLRLIISGADIVHAPIFKKDTTINHGRHVVHFGGDFDSHVLVPIIST